MDRALNFDTQDSTIIGGVDLWTTKAAGDDKKLYKRIERILEDRHRDVLAAVADMPAQSVAQFADDFNLDRNTVFGSFKEPANRHKFAYLIATLNATHVDYDYANTCNPDEFRYVFSRHYLCIMLWERDSIQEPLWWSCVLRAKALLEHKANFILDNSTNFCQARDEGGLYA